MAVMLLSSGAMGILPASCGPSFESGFASIDPQERTAALLQAGRDQDRASIPQIILLLDSSDPAERMLAGDLLLELTGEDFGYRHYDSPMRRAQAVRQWQTWWNNGTGISPVMESPLAP